MTRERQITVQELADAISHIQTPHYRAHEPDDATRQAVSGIAIMIDAARRSIIPFVHVRSALASIQPIVDLVEDIVQKRDLQPTTPRLGPPPPWTPSMTSYQPGTAETADEYVRRVMFDPHMPADDSGPRGSIDVVHVPIPDLEPGFLHTVARIATKADRLAATARANRRTMVVVSPVHRLHPELRGIVPTIEWPDPPVESVARMLVDQFFAQASTKLPDYTTSPIDASRDELVQDIVTVATWTTTTSHEAIAATVRYAFVLALAAAAEWDPEADDAPPLPRAEWVRHLNAAAVITGLA